jgi:hypothetical protein
VSPPLPPNFKKYIHVSNFSESRGEEETERIPKRISDSPKQAYDILNFL